MLSPRAGRRTSTSPFGQPLAVHVLAGLVQEPLLRRRQRPQTLLVDFLQDLVQDRLALAGGVESPPPAPTRELRQRVPTAGVDVGTIQLEGKKAPQGPTKVGAVGNLPDLVAVQFQDLVPDTQEHQEANDDKDNLISLWKKFRNPAEF